MRLPCGGDTTGCDWPSAALVDCNDVAAMPAVPAPRKDRRETLPCLNAILVLFGKSRRDLEEKRKSPVQCIGCAGCQDTNAVLFLADVNQPRENHIPKAKRFDIGGAGGILEVTRWQVGFAMNQKQVTGLC